MGVYDRQIASALRAIKKRGQLVTWTPQDVTTNPAQPWRTQPVVGAPTFQVSIVFLSLGSTELNALFHLIKGTSVPDGAPRGLMGAVPFVPAINDVVLRGTINLTVKALDVLAPNGDVILYKIEFA